MFQKKNQRNEHRLNFVRAYYNAFADDLTHFSSNQIAFANKAIQNFDSTSHNSMPVFEQGIYEILGGIRANEKRLIDKSSKAFEQYGDMTERAIKEYEGYVQAFNSSMIEGKTKKADKDVFTEAHKYSITIKHMILLLLQICDDLTRMKPLALAKEMEYIKAFSLSFKNFGLFTQENLGNFMGTTLMKSKFIFDIVGKVYQINEKFSLEQEYYAGNVLLSDDLEALNASREMINQDMKVGGR